MEQNQNDYLEHYGVLGMKWGRRKQPKSNNKKEYISKNRDDISRYGQRGANRIEKRIQEKGITRKQARRRESGRQFAIEAGIVVGAMALTNPQVLFYKNVI